MEKTPEQVRAELTAQLNAKIAASDAREETKDDTAQIPHQAIITLTAIVNQQMPNGEWHPRSCFNDQFFLLLRGNSEKEVTDDLKKQLERLKEEWQKNGGSIGRLKTSKT